MNIMPVAHPRIPEALRSLKPGFYCEKLDSGRMMIIEVFQNWVPPEGGNKVSGFYKNVFNCEEDAVIHLLKRGAKQRRPIETNLAPLSHTQEGEQEHCAILEPADTQEVAPQHTAQGDVQEEVRAHDTPHLPPSPSQDAEPLPDVGAYF
jgi:hypothetical protein